MIWVNENLRRHSTSSSFSPSHLRTRHKLYSSPIQSLALAVNSWKRWDFESLCSFRITSWQTYAVPPSDLTEGHPEGRSCWADYLDIARIPPWRAECGATLCALQGQMSHIIPAVRLGFTPSGSNLARRPKLTPDKPEVRKKKLRVFCMAWMQVPHQCVTKEAKKQCRNEWIVFFSSYCFPILKINNIS